MIVNPQVVLNKLIIYTKYQQKKNPKYLEIQCENDSSILIMNISFIILDRHLLRSLLLFNESQLCFFKTFDQNVPF